MKHCKIVGKINKDLLDISQSSYNKSCGDFTLEDLFTVESVVLAARRCAAGFRRKKDTNIFMQSCYASSLVLRDKVLSKRFKPKYYRTRVIKERGKERVITPPTFETKVVQKVICDYLLRPLLEPKLVTTCYAAIQGRGTDKAYDDIVKALNKTLNKENWKDYVVVMTDFTSYFQLINTKIVFKELARYIKDDDILDLIKMFSPEEYGFSLGNEISQVPASWYPSKIDHYFKDRLRRSYFRYMDDIFFITKKENLDSDLTILKSLSKELDITLKDNKIAVYNLGAQLSWCKENFYFNKSTKRYYKMLNYKRVSNEKRKLSVMTKKLEADLLKEEDIDCQYKTVYNSLLNHGNSYKICQELDFYRESLSLKTA